jgi:hypothetical protein
MLAVMKPDISRTPGGVSIADLYPTLTEIERREAEENLRQYVAVLSRIAERLDEEKRLSTQPHLDKS